MSRMRLCGSHRSNWDDRSISLLKSLRAANYSHEQIAERLGRTKRAIRWKIGALGGRSAIAQSEEKK